ncbi:adenosylcobinamide-phosphate synthase CbiB [Paenibacillus hamazuiensis]|uniref:adenosylcobinamide-phosphate synthase CbiB n=1 Tax=Paenibacillus hamazuiensis TaxID=2936508 RepID=UPI00200F7E53|nr:adenosylcobinamide-phosphate synthase CbiB [Paenibacillus hamazuiensis]
MDSIALAAAALAVDLLVGDPRALPHPVVGFGKLIGWFDRHFRRPAHPPWRQTCSGIALVVFVLSVTFALSAGLIALASRIHPYAAAALTVWLTSTTIAAKGLRDAAMLVYEPLAAGRLDEARKYVGYIVGRDTDLLSEREVSRAAVETVAENIVDAIVSPLFYALIGGVYGALLYRAVNTLDSMVGYKNDKYRYFGWASARLDDVLNYIPARITGLLLWLVTLLIRPLCAKGAWLAMRRDAAKHPSPNSGIPEAAVAGALGIQLGGENRYGGDISVRARMGDALRDIVPEDIPRTIRIMYAAVSLLMTALCASLGVAWWR